MPDQEPPKVVAPLYKRCGWRLHRWIMIQSGSSSARMFDFWCWVLDKIEAVCGEPPENAAFHTLIDAWISMQKDEDEH